MEMSGAVTNPCLPSNRFGRGVSDRVRQVELDALRTNRELADGNLSPDALVLLISAIPKFLNREKGIGVQTAHRELVDAVERYLDSLEPKTRSRRRKRSPRG
jgi:hypothetical protein